MPEAMETFLNTLLRDNVVVARSDINIVPDNAATSPPRACAKKCQVETGHSTKRLGVEATATKKSETRHIEARWSASSCTQAPILGYDTRSFKDASTMCHEIRWKNDEDSKSTSQAYLPRRISSDVVLPSNRYAASYANPKADERRGKPRRRSLSSEPHPTRGYRSSERLGIPSAGIAAATYASRPEKTEFPEFSGLSRHRNLDGTNPLDSHQRAGEEKTPAHQYGDRNLPRHANSVTTSATVGFKQTPVALYDRCPPFPSHLRLPTTHLMTRHTTNERGGSESNLLEYALDVLAS